MPGDGPPGAGTPDVDSEARLDVVGPELLPCPEAALDAGPVGGVLAEDDGVDFSVRGVVVAEAEEGRVEDLLFKQPVGDLHENHGFKFSMF